MSEYRKCGLYVRVSTERQAVEGESLDEQEERLREFCRVRNWKVVKVYREEGKSAKDTNRPAFKELLKGIENGLIDTLVVKKLDRLSRSIIDFEKIYNFLQSHHVDLVSLHENFDTTTAIGRAVVRIVMVFAQLEREQTAERTLDVMEHRAKEGLWNGGYPPLGYDLKDGKLVVNSKEAKVVKLIFEKYLEFASYTKVAKWLNEQGYRTKEFISRRSKKQGGSEFIDTYIARVLKHPVYIGKIKYKGKLYDGQHTPIIDEETFNLVQEIIKSNYKRTSSIKRQTKHKFLLEGLLKCGVCGSYMTPTWAKSKGRRYFYYECTSNQHKGRGTCEGGSIRADLIENLVLERMKEISQNEILLYRLVHDASAEAKAKVDKLEEKRVILKLRIKELEDKGRKYTRQLVEIKGKAAERFLLKEIEEVENQLKELEKELTAIESEIQRLKEYVLNAELIKDSFKYLSKIFPQLSQPEQKGLLKMLIKEIVFTPSKISIQFFEIPEEEIRLNLPKIVSFEENFKWLPGRVSNPQPPG